MGRREEFHDGLEDLRLGAHGTIRDKIAVVERHKYLVEPWRGLARTS